MFMYLTCCILTGLLVGKMELCWRISYPSRSISFALVTFNPLFLTSHCKCNFLKSTKCILFFFMKRKAKPMRSSLSIHIYPLHSTFHHLNYAMDFTWTQYLRSTLWVIQRIRLTTSPPSVSQLSRKYVGTSMSHNPVGLHGLLWDSIFF
jgi:hypothetical protein